MNGINGNGGLGAGYDAIQQQRPKITLRELNKDHADFVLENVDLRYVLPVSFLDSDGRYRWLTSKRGGSTALPTRCGVS